MHTKISAGVLCAGVLLTACGPDAPQPVPPVPEADASTAAATITGDELKGRIGVLAADSMRGRNTPSPELDEVAAWIAEQFRDWGLQPGAGQEYIQRYPVQTVAFDPEGSSARIGDGALAVGTEVLPLGSASAVDVQGPLVVLTGTGPVPDSLTQGLEGKQVLVLGTPDGGGRRGGAGQFTDTGVTAIWTLDTRDDQAWQSMADRATRSRTIRPSDGGGAVILSVREPAARRVLAAAGLDVDALMGAADQPLALHETDVQASASLAVQVLDDTSAPNVVAILPGSDPTLSGEYVIYSAHMDHVGVGRPDESGDSIYNGADDDASGTATVMEIAEAMASLPRAPRRSMVFLLVSGEEKGLWGSSYFAEHPTVPLDSVAADLNADMVGRNWPDTIVAIGKEHSDLGETLERVNAAHPEIGMTAIDDRWPEQNFYRRSDHFNFARKGVPILFFFNGTHEDYHRPSDEVDKIDGEKAARIGRLLFYLGLDVADRDQRPQWNPQSYQEIVEGN